MERYFAVLFADLERHTDAWQQHPRDRIAHTIAEYRYLAESLAGQYGSVYQEWAGDGHMFLFESADTAAQFGLRLIERWGAAAGVLHIPLRLGCHFGECTPLDGGSAWIGHANAIAKRAESMAQPDSLYVTESVLDLLDLPLYKIAPVGTFALKGDHVPDRRLHRVASFDRAALNAKPPEELTAEDWFRKAVSLVGTDREWSDEELDCCSRAIALRPDFAEAHNHLAVLLRARGREADAARHYQQALRLRPDYPEAHYNYAALLAARGSTAGAAGHYGEALRLRPDYVDAHHGCAALLATGGQLGPASEHFQAALDLRPDSPEAHNDLGVLLERAGDPGAAEAHYRAALGIRPDYPEAHYNYALLLEARGDAAAAEEHYRTAIRLWPEYGEAHNNLAILLQDRGDLDAAAEHYRRALETRPQDPEVHYNYGLLLRRLGREEDAERELRTAYELAPDVPAFSSALETPN